MKKLAIFLMALAVFSCKDGKKKDKLLPRSGGSVNHLTIVTQNDIWEGEIGDEVRGIFAAPIYGLPQEEPRYTLKQMLPKAFHEFVKRSRTYIDIERGKAKGISFVKDVYASPQLAIKISGMNNAEIIAVLKENQKEMHERIRKMEFDHKLSLIRENQLQSTVVQETFDIDLSVLFSYRVAKKTDDFIWLRKDIKNGDMNLLIYELPTNTIKKDSLLINHIIKTRDSIGKAHIPGRQEGMHMITERAFTPYLQEAKVNAYDAVETRGTWEVYNDYMAGPFVNYVIDDTKNNRQLVLEGFTYSPNVSKRDFMFELEASIQSLQIK